MLTRNNAGSQTDSRTVMVVNQGGLDRLHHTFQDTPQSDQERGDANLYEIDVAGDGIETDNLDNAYVRIGIRGSDEWRPEHVFVWGERATGGDIIPIAIETDIGTRLSTDAGEGNISIPLRPVGRLGRTQRINRLLMLMTTRDSKDSGTEHQIELEVTTGAGNLAVKFTVRGTDQEDQKRGQANFYFVPVTTRLTRADLNNNSVRLRILGDDAWRPASFYLFGLDNASGRPERLVPLVHLRTWPHGTMSEDRDEGPPSVPLALV